MSRMAVCMGLARTATEAANDAPSATGNLTGYL